MRFQAVKGTRDFYPDDMAVRNWMMAAWRRVSIRNGFVEFDGPTMEYLDLYTAKSGEGIVSELFSLTDRGGRQLALRPELTPTLARMVNARINALPRPIKWFSIPRCYRGEQPQKGRLREFFQWNIDIIGPDDVLADAECVFTAVDALREMGLGPGDVRVHYSSRRLLAAVLAGFALPDDAAPAVLAVLDKRSKLPEPAFEEMFAKALPDARVREGVRTLLAMPDVAGVPADALAQRLGIAAAADLAGALDNLRRFGEALEAFGIADWCRYDTGIVRGLAYYTGIVFEVLDVAGQLRAVAGGGRYDNLLEILGGPKVGAAGFGMGDAVLGILLQEKGKLPALGWPLDCYVVTETLDIYKDVLPVVARLRQGGVSTDFLARPLNIGKALKEANRRQARAAVILKAGAVAVKDLASGQQQEVALEDFLAQPRNFLPHQ